MRGPLEFDDLGGSSAPLVRDLCHVPERGEEHVDGPDNMDRLVSAFELGVDQSAFKPNGNWLVDKETRTRQHTRLAGLPPGDSARDITLSSSAVATYIKIAPTLCATGEPAFIAPRSVRPKLPILAPTGQE